jgi:uncharacterized protein (TIGR02246 family)
LTHGRLAFIVMDTDEQQIRKAIERWREASAAGDLESVLSLMADDVVFLTPSQPPMTKDIFAKSFLALPAKIEMQQEIKEIYVSGDLAYCWSHITVTIARNRRAGHILTIFRKLKSGQWVLSRDANLLAAQ